MDIQAWYKDLCEQQIRIGREQVLREFEPRIAEAQRRAEVIPLVYQFERRMDRSLTASERGVLMARVKMYGSAHLADLVLELSGPELDAWLEHNSGAQSG